MECGLWNFDLRKQLNALSGGIMGHPSRNMEDSGAESNANYDGSAQEVSEY